MLRFHGDHARPEAAGTVRQAPVERRPERMGLRRRTQASGAVQGAHTTGCYEEGCWGAGADCGRGGFSPGLDFTAALAGLIRM